jgi:glucose/arabinose dehydrogenase
MPSMAYPTMARLLYWADMRRRVPLGAMRHRLSRTAPPGRRRRPALALTGIGLAIVALSGLPGYARGQEPTGIALPPGFHIGTFASGLGSPRFMTLDPSGTILLSIPRQGRVVALPDRDRDGQADAVVTVVEDLDRPHGLAFKDGHLYVAETGRVLRFRYDGQAHRASQAEVVVPNLPAGGNHWTRTIAFDREGRLYVSIGSSCNACRERDPRRAAIVRYNADGTGERLFATGLRNAVGLAVHPAAGALWATVNERDWRGDDVPPDLITEVKDGAFYGWPRCMTVGGKAVPDDGVGGEAACADVTLPTVEIQAHSAPIGLAFYTGRQFPPEYRGDLFVAYRGSWNRSVPTGYKVVRVRFKDGKPAGVEDFATGWLHDQRVLGRPVDLIVGRDGALYLSDQGAARLYRITYRP